MDGINQIPGGRAIGGVFGAGNPGSGSLPALIAGQVVYVGATNLPAGTSQLQIDDTMNAAAGVEMFLQVAPTILQSVTAGYTAVDVSVTESSVGSGIKLLFKGSVGGTAKFQVNSLGNIATGGAANPSSQLDAQTGGLGTRILTKVADATLAISNSTELVDATGVAIVISLPTASSAARRQYTIKKIDVSVNTVTIDGSGAETIDGALTVVLVAQWSAVTIQSDGTSWFILSNKN